MIDREKYKILWVTRREVLLGLGSLTLGATALGLVGCGDDSNGDRSDDGSSASPEPGTSPDNTLSDKTISVGIRRGFDHVTPIERTGTLTGRFTNSMESLTERRLDGSIGPALAESWEFDEDGLGITWHLRRDVKFHDGSTLTSEDVVFTWNEMRSEKSTASYITNFTRVTEVTARDEATVYMKFDSPFFEIPDFMESGFTVAPKAYVESVGWDEFTKRPIGTGPFKITSLVPGGDWTLERFEDYWGPIAPMARLELRNIGEDSSRVAALRSGDVQLIENVLPHQIPELEGDSKIRVDSFPSILANGIRFNLRIESPLSDVRVRRALNLTVDRDAIVERIFRGRAKAATAICPPGLHVGCPADVPPWKYDPDEAKRLLSEAGYPNGFKLEQEFVLRNDELYGEQVYELVRQYFEAVGVRAKFTYVPFATQQERQRKGDISGVELHSQNITWDASFDLIRHHTSGSAQSLTVDTDWDDRIAEAVALQPNERRVAAVSELLKEFAVEHVPYLVLYYPDYIWAYRTDEIAEFSPPQGWSVYPREYHLMKLA